MSTLAEKLSRLAYMDPRDPAAPRLRAEVEEMQAGEMHAYGRELAARGMAGQKLSSLHWEAEARKART